MLGRCLKGLFEGQGEVQNEEFWDDFIADLEYDVGTGLLPWNMSENPSESEVGANLLHPLLKRVTQLVSAGITPLGSFTFHSALNHQVETWVKGGPGRRPEVDYVLSGHGGPGACASYIIPVETKVKVNLLNDALVGLQCGEFVRSKAGVGLLLDSSKVSFCFSLFSDDNMPLPTTMLSPLVNWRVGDSVSAWCCAFC